MNSQKVALLILGAILITTLVSAAEPIFEVLDNDQTKVTSEMECDLSKENLAPTVENAEALYNNCDCYAEKNDLAGARECYAKVKDYSDNIFKTDPSNFIALDIKIDAEDRIHELDGDIYKLPPGSNCTCVRNSNYDSIVAGYDGVLRLDPSNAIAWNNRGALLGELCCKEDARTSFDEALRINSSLPEPWYNKGVSIFQENPREALQCFNRSIELDPGLAEAWFNRYPLLMPSDLDISSRAYNEAVASYDRALELNPNLGLFRSPYLIYKRIQ